MKPIATKRAPGYAKDKARRRDTFAFADCIEKAVSPAQAKADAKAVAEFIRKHGVKKMPAGTVAGALVPTHYNLAVKHGRGGRA